MGCPCYIIYVAQLSIIMQLFFLGFTNVYWVRQSMHNDCFLFLYILFNLHQEKSIHHSDVGSMVPGATT